MIGVVHPEPIGLEALRRGVEMMLPTPDECRRRADEVERMARHAHDADAMRLFRDIAGSWRELANILEMNPPDQVETWTKFRTG